MIQRHLIAVEPKSFPEYEKAITDAGAAVAKLAPEVGALIWTDYSQPQLLAETLVNNPQIEWVQLPFAGVDAFSETIASSHVRFTSAKGSYREPVAEHALALALALARRIPERSKATSWGKKFAASLYDSSVTIVGAGGITEELIKLLEPFRASITVVRNLDQPMQGASKTLALDSIFEAVAEADFVVLACALTAKTHHLFDDELLAKMRPEAYLVNIARGPVIHTDSLIRALESGTIAGAAVDVTEPEPLPEGHPLWKTKNILITPHTADTKEMVTRMFAVRVKENVAAYLGKGEWVGLVDPELGY